MTKFFYNQECNSKIGFIIHVLIAMNEWKLLKNEFMHSHFHVHQQGMDI